MIDTMTSQKIGLSFWDTLYIYIYIFVTYFLVRSSYYIKYRIINEWYIEQNVAETDRGAFKRTVWYLLGRSEKKNFSERSSGTNLNPEHLECEETMTLV